MSRPKTKGGDATSVSPAPKRVHPIHEALEMLGGRQAGWTIETLARKCECHPATIRRHIAGSAKMSDFRFMFMLKILKIDLDFYYKVGPYARKYPSKPIVNLDEYRRA